MASASFSEVEGSSNFIKVVKEGKYRNWPQVFNQKGTMKLDITNDDSGDDGDGCLKDMEFGLNISFSAFQGDNTAGYSVTKRDKKHQGIFSVLKSRYQGANGKNTGWTDYDVTGDYQGFYVDGDFNMRADVIFPMDIVNIGEQFTGIDGDDLVESDTFPDGFRIRYGDQWNGVATKLIHDGIFLVGEDNDAESPTDRVLTGIGIALGGGMSRIYDIQRHDLIQMTD